MDTKSASASDNVFPLPISRKGKENVSYKELTQELAGLPARALRLVIDCERYQCIAESNHAIVDYISMELQLWSSIIGARTVQSFYLIHPHNVLAPYELTQISHVIASRFQVERSGSKKYVVVSDYKGINSEFLALTKGLGFNGYQLIVEDQMTDDLEVLSKKVRLLKDYAIGRIGIQLLTSECLTAMCDCVHKIQSLCAPDYICIGKAWDENDLIASIENNIPDITDSREIDVLELGPEGSSKLSELKVQNYYSTEKYKNSLDGNRIPIHVQ